MDVGRTCGTTRIRFFRNSNLATPVRWYRAPAGAKVFPGLNRFALGYWDMDRLEYLGIGQTAPAALVYGKGEVIPTSHGQHFCGSLLDYRDGLIYPPPGPPVFYDVWGTPICCAGAGPPVPPYPGLATGGELGMSGEDPILGEGDLGLFADSGIATSGEIGLDGFGPETGDLGLDS